MACSCAASVGGPSAIAWLVAPVIVDALYRKAWRTFTHIRSELFKNAPALADHNSSATVMAVRTVSRTQTSPHDVVPASVCLGDLAVSGFAVSKRRTPRRGNLSSKAATAARSSRGEIGRAFANLCATLASANPPDLTVIGPLLGGTNNSQSSEHFRAQVIRVEMQWHMAVSR